MCLLLALSILYQFTELFLVWPKHFVYFKLQWRIFMNGRAFLLLEMYIKDSKQKLRLFNAIESIPCVARKAKWALDWIPSLLFSASVPFSGLRKGAPCLKYPEMKACIVTSLAFYREATSKVKS